MFRLIIDKEDHLPKKSLKNIDCLNSDDLALVVHKNPLFFNEVTNRPVKTIVEFSGPAHGKQKIGKIRKTSLVHG